MNSGENHEPPAGGTGSTDRGTGVCCEGEESGEFWERALLWLESKLKGWRSSREGSGRLRRKAGFWLYAHPWDSFSQRSL